VTSSHHLATQHASAVATLSTWTASDPAQEALRRAYIDHLAAHPDATSRDGPPAHLTASCLVLDERAAWTLLTLHRKGGFWVQFGGHAEARDVSLAETALREGREESGIADLTLLGPDPTDLDRHALSARFGRCREHLDVGFVAVVARTIVPSVSLESNDVAWWPTDALPAGVVADLPVLLARAASRIRAQRP
jgi:8-oxo-dGTP pyrophosphatase MutT (NUDIX family)